MPKEKKGGEIEKSKEFEESLSVLLWNRVLMSTLGVWPLRPSNFVYFITFGYFCYEMALEYLDLFLHISSLEYVLINLTENIAYSIIFVRILTLRLYNNDFGKLIIEAEEDFNADNYTDEEKRIFVEYYAKSKMFMKVLVANTALTATSYYLKPLFSQLGPIMEYVGKSNDSNTTFVFLLPYRFHIFYDISDASTYFWTYLSQFPFVFVSWFGQSAADCLMVTLVYHVSGQMAVLASRIENINTDPLKSTKKLHSIVCVHARLLRMGEVIKEAFSAMLLCHLVGATLLVCILGYQILTCLATGETAILMSMVAYIVLVLVILHAYCTIGESLITESERVNGAYYNCNWYEMPRKNANIIILCMARSQKPLQLTAGKFSMFCQKTLTDTIKASMGYLSVLRTIM